MLNMEGGLAVRDALLKIKNIGKFYGPVSVLEGVDWEIEPGKIYALAGENGAGKSTLCNIISGAILPSHGKLNYDGNDYDSFDIKTAKEEVGIRMVHQELQVLPLMTIMENVFIGNEITHFGFVDKKTMNQKASQMLESVGLSLDPTTKVKDVEIAGRQLIEIARGINGHAKLVILDEPTSSLSSTEVNTLFQIMRRLKDQGISFIFISHRLEEALEIADTIIILKDGKKVAELAASETNQEEIIKYMVGRNYDDYYNRVRTFKGEEVLRVENLTTEAPRQHSAYMPQNVSFSLEQGEVLGIAGLVGAGRTELIRTIFGDMKAVQSRILLDGKEVKIRNSNDALKLGLAWVTEDRKQQGLILTASIKDNVSLVVLKNFVKSMLIRDDKIRDLANEYIGTLQIRTTGPEQVTGNLSGGNQQKVVLGKWLAANPRILVLDEPTRGIDVGAKAEIYKLINQLTSEGIAVILISSELPEIIGMSDRMLVMYEGRITGELKREEFTEELVMQYAIGRSKKS